MSKNKHKKTMQRKHGQLNKFKFGNNYKNNTKNKVQSFITTRCNSEKKLKNKNKKTKKKKKSNKEVTARRLTCEIIK